MLLKIENLKKTEYNTKTTFLKDLFWAFFAFILKCSDRKWGVERGGETCGKQVETNMPGVEPGTLRSKDSEPYVGCAVPTMPPAPIQKLL